MSPAVIDATEAFDNETEAGIILKQYTVAQLMKIAQRIAQRYKIQFAWDDEQERIVFFELE